MHQKRGGIHWHILLWVENGTMPDNVVQAEMPRYHDTSNVVARYARYMVNKYQMHRECFPERCNKGPRGQVLKTCKYGFPFKTPQLKETLDEEEVRYLYVRRCKEDALVVPYNMDILLLWGASMNLQKVSSHGFEQYLGKYISKPEPSLQIMLSENVSQPQKYLRTRIVGACEALDVMLGFHQHQMTRQVIFLPTELSPSTRFLKPASQLTELDTSSNDVYHHNRFEVYLRRPVALRDIHYSEYFQWWRQVSNVEEKKIKIL